MTLLDGAHKTKNIDYFFFSYPGEGHGFQKPQDIEDSTDRTIAFLRTHLV